MARGMVAVRRAMAAAFCCAVLLSPSEAHLSGGAYIPVSLDELARRSEWIVEGPSLGLRSRKVRIEAGRLASKVSLAPGQSALEFEVRELGVRVERVLSPSSGGPVPGEELWFVDPDAYAFGSIGRLAEVATLAVPCYSGTDAQAQAGRRLVAYAETAAHRRGRGEQTAGLDDALWLTVSRAFAPAAEASKIPTHSQSN
jgi:hypothetical protein